MALSAGSRLGSYEILTALGAGGMGVVYRARDTKLGRDVALKVLPEAFTLDPDRLARFTREAHVLASLNHPNIAAIYGVEESSGSQALVLELVEGPTLADRIAQGSVPLDEALSIARQIADALETAHEHGIVHRDLKPANIKLRPDGTVKVLDFGLAKVRESEGVSASLTHSPTMIAVSTPGLILGTAAYMSPEQAKGREADRTSDLWALGCVLYEMLAGRAVFEGATISEILAEILKTEPDWRRLPADTPQGIRRVLRRCLQKERRRRLHDAADVRLEIEEAQSGPDREGQVTPDALERRRRRLLSVSLLALVMLIAAVAIVRIFRSAPSAPPAPEVRFEIITPPTADPASLAISPDGRKIVFAATTEGRSQLWLRSLDSVSSRPLPRTNDSSYPFWSPDSRSVGFFADGKLKRIEVDAGTLQTLAEAPGSRGGAWNHNDILFAPRGSDGIFRIAATGGEPAALTRLAAEQVSHRFPQFLPDEHHFLYYVIGTPDVRGIYIGDLEGTTSQRLLNADAAAVYASSGQLLFARQGTLFAQDFEPVGLVLTGNPFQVAEQVTVDAELAVSGVTSSAAGPIAYRAGAAGAQRQFVWFGRSGNEIGKLGKPDNAVPLNPSISPAGQRLALQRTVDGNLDIWLLEIGRGALSRFTVDAANDRNPVWSPDGSRIVFTSSRKGPSDLYERSVTGVVGSEVLLLATPQNKVAMDWSPDGRFLLYRVQDPKLGFDLWALPRDGDRKPFPVVQTAFEEREPQFSPDGRWIAYQSNESGRFEIYVQPFQRPGGKSPISTNGGAQVRWRRDGKELFYIELDGRLMAVPIHSDSRGDEVEAGAPVPLFATRVGGAVRGIDKQQYVVAPDGQRFLMNTLIEEAAPPITVMLNWAGRNK